MVKLETKNKIYKSKKGLDQANKARGELGQKTRIIKYIFTEYVKLFENNNLLINSLRDLKIVFSGIRNVLIDLKKQNDIYSLDLPCLLARDMLLLFISKKGEIAYFDIKDKYKNNIWLNLLMQNLEELNNNNPLEGCGIKLSFDDEIELLSFYDEENLVKRADRAIIVIKWCLDILENLLLEAQKPEQGN